ncbi:BTAD domain-containing putative transcriptional regulator [Saccharomonospora sp.]|uniref:AfsR/SARP family transcriptional regulator n=1 Tax=Saccharomonospora sp. TaxID=33913 RepID=UPI00262EABA0|nr:BTAD domain-containing putative transcriptional regulator [Saccharomonospora sp.]
MKKGPGHLFVSVLGPLRIIRRGADQPVTDKALRAVLSVLVANAGRSVAAETLIDMAWEPHELPSNPLDSLHTRITRLRTLLAPEADIGWSAGGCVLTIAAERADAVLFERLVEAARWCSAHEAIAILERALHLWRGEALPDLRRNGREHPDGMRLRQLRARAVEDLAARELEVGAVEDAAGRLLALLSAEPLRERACGYAMWALHRLGMTTDAVTCYDQLVERLRDELGEEPSIELRKTYRAVTGRDPTPPHEPTGRTPFVGRGHELARLSTMLERDRIVTVTGPAGCGKTRLVSEALSTTDVPMTFVRLSTCDETKLYETVATAMGVHSRGAGDATDDLPAALAEYLFNRRHILVLDGCEDLLTSVRALVRRLRSHCRDVTVVTINRVRLGLAGEQVLPLGPLARDGVPDPLLSRAGKLFLDRARRIRPDFPADDGEAELARTLLNGTTCLPLTVELLAARATADDPAIPSPWPPDLVEWSYERLPESRRELLDSLTVFGGDIDVASAESVVDTDGDAENALTELTRTGLLTSVETDAGTRYRLPDLVRRFVTRRFAGTESERKARQRHALWCADLITGAAASDDDPAGFALLCRMEDDVCAALRWAVSEEPVLAAELTGQIGLLTRHRPRARLLPWQLEVARDPDPRLSRHALAAASGADAAMRCGLSEEGLRLATRAAELATTPQQRCAGVHTLICVYYDLEDDDRAASACHELIGLADVPDCGSADAHSFLSLVATRNGHRQEALRSADVAARFARASGSGRHIALATYAEGRARTLADLDEGASVLARARSQAKDAHATWIAASAGTALADTLLALGRIPEAAKLLQHTLDDWHRMRAPRRLSTCVEVGVRCLASAGDRAAAETLAEELAGRHTLKDPVVAKAARTLTRALGDVFGAGHT